MRSALSCYAAFIVYASLFPFTDWRRPAGDLLGFLAEPWPDHLSKPDVLANVLAYIPLGLLLVLLWRGRRSVRAPVLLATLIGAALSFLMEFVQQFLPSRVPSAVDVITNTSGAFIGALVARIAGRDASSGNILRRWRARWVKPGRLFDLGLIAAGAWALSQVTPLVPSLDIGKLREGVAPIALTLQHPETFRWMQAAVYALYIAGLALLVRTLGAPGRPAVALFFAVTAAVLLYKIVAVGRQLSFEALAGALAAAVLTPVFLGLRANAVARTSALFVVGGFVCAELAPGPDDGRNVFNWLPFRGQEENPLVGLESVFEFLWPSAALAYLARFAGRAEQQRAIAWWGGGAVAIAAFALEWYQQLLPGRYGDITTVLLLGVGWLLVWSIPANRSTSTRGTLPNTYKMRSE